MNCNNVRVSNTEISNTLVGIQLFNVNNTLITSNSVNSNIGDGINISGFANVTVTGNNLSNNGVPAAAFGIFESPNNRIGSPALTAYHNNFFYDNIFVGTGNDMLDHGYPSGGNFWSDYPGIDNCSGPSQNICPNSDGIGDTPFFPASFIADHYPLMRPYLPTPDNTPPSWLPNTQLTVTSVSQTHAALYWMRATDDVAVVSYQVYRGSTLVANISADKMVQSGDYLAGYGYQYTADNLTPGTTYTFQIVAVDEAGNHSVSGLTASISTPSQPLSWWQQYWYFFALAGGASATMIVLLMMRRRKRILGPSSVTTPDSPSNLDR